MKIAVVIVPNIPWQRYLWDPPEVPVEIWPWPMADVSSVTTVSHRQSTNRHDPELTLTPAYKIFRPSEDPLKVWHPPPSIDQSPKHNFVVVASPNRTMEGKKR